MEPRQHLGHPSEEELAAFGDPALGPDTLERLAVHLDSCPACQARLERMEPVLSQYRRCLDAVHARVQRPQPRQAALQTLMGRLETAGKPRWFTPTQVAWAGGIAASVITCAILLSLSGDASELRAENLLIQASAAPRQNAPQRRLRIRTQTVSFLRPAALGGETREEGQAASVRAHFAEASYDWRDPLSAQSYSAWRHTLKHKTSKVSGGDQPTGPSQQKIETTTDDGTLRTASLTFDAKLAPVSGLFQFSDREWVEITALPDADKSPVAEVVPAPVSAPSVAGTTGNVPREPLAERELNVLAAINVLHTSASEPIEVSTGSGDILVTTYRLTDEQEKKLAASLEGIQGVTLHAVHESVDQKQPGPRLLDPAEVILQTSQDLSFETHSLTDLSDRFPAPAQATLSASAQAKLRDLRMQHVREMNRAMGRLQRELQEASPNFRLAPETSGSAEGKLADLANSASTVGRLIITLYAADKPASDQAALWPQISAEFARLRNLAKVYSRTIEEHRDEQRPPEK